MKNSPAPLKLVLALLLTAFVPNLAPAQALESRIYFAANAGVALAQDVSILEADGPVTGAKTDFDPGAHFNFAFGYRLKPWLAVEIETGGSANSFADGYAALAHVPLLANVVLRAPGNRKFQPFIGAGGGVDFAVIELDWVSIAGSPLLDGTDTDAVPAWHAFAGFNFAINESMALGVTYRYFASGGPTWDIRYGGRLRFDDGRTHNIGVSFTWHF